MYTHIHKEQLHTHQEQFDPGEYDPHFSFSLSLNPTDYLFLALYIVFVAPIEAVLWMSKAAYGTVCRTIQSVRRTAEAHSDNRLLSLVTKLF
jgi:hypothetical protein